MSPTAYIYGDYIYTPPEMTSSDEKIEKGIFKNWTRRKVVIDTQSSQHKEREDMK